MWVNTCQLYGYAFHVFVGVSWAFQVFFTLWRWKPRDGSPDRKTDRPEGQGLFQLVAAIGFWYRPFESEGVDLSYIRSPGPFRLRKRKDLLGWAERHIGSGHLRLALETLHTL